MRGRLFTLCARIHALDALKAAFRAYIKKAGLALIMDEEKARFCSFQLFVLGWQPCPVALGGLAGACAWVVSCADDRHALLQDKDMVRLLLEMKAGLDRVLSEAFQRSETFGHALKDAFEHFINQRANRCVWGLA